MARLRFAPAWQPSLLRSAPKAKAGGKGIRTPDFQLAKLALYQLSYAPMESFECRLPIFDCKEENKKAGSIEHPAFVRLWSWRNCVRALRTRPSFVSVPRLAPPNTPLTRPYLGRPLYP